VPDRNRVELEGTVVSKPAVRTTPAGTPVAAFRLQVEADDRDPALPGCVVPVVVLGEEALRPGLEQGSKVRVTGALAERRWKNAAGVRQSRIEILARTLGLL
jgi:primosomal replication protein N